MLVKSAHVAMYLGNPKRKFAPDGKGVRMSDRDLAEFRATRNATKAGEPGDCLAVELAFRSGALLLFNDEGKPMTIAEYDASLGAARVSRRDVSGGGG